MTIELSDILDEKTEVYCASRGIPLSDYKLIGIHQDGGSIEEFAKIVPDCVEVVTRYRIFTINKFPWCRQSGIGLVPKTRVGLISKPVIESEQND